LARKSAHKASRRCPRSDRRLLIEAEPELAALVRAAGVCLPDFSTGRGRAAACEDIHDVKDCAFGRMVT
jgi:hypothetical protein